MRVSILTAGLLAGAASAQPQYSIREIAFPEASALIRDINDAGQVPIDAFDSFIGDHNAYVWQDGVLTALPSHPQSENVLAEAIDENGVVYGRFADPGATRDAFFLPMRWVNGAAETLPSADTTGALLGKSSATTGVLCGGALPFAYGTSGWENMHGWGTGEDAELEFGRADPRRAMLWSAAGRAVLPRMPNGDSSWATDVNDAGQTITLDSNHNRSWSFLIDPARGVIELGSLGVGSGGNGRGTGTIATALNERGQVVGTSFLGLAAHPFLWEDGVMIDLGLPEGFAEAEALDINDHGDVVGRARLVVDPVRYAEDGGFLYTDGVLYNLQDLIPQGSGWQPTRAIAINNRGQILIAERRGDVFSSRYAVLTPRN